MIAAIYSRKSIARSLRILLASLGVLLFATSASAECAWALWVNPGNTATGWRIAGGVPAWYASKADCQGTATYQRAGTPSQSGDVMCLPQGVQPMGTILGGYEYGPWRGGK